jgi:hypothetical protein
MSPRMRPLTCLLLVSLACAHADGAGADGPPPGQQAQPVSGLLLESTPGWCGLGIAPRVLGFRRVRPSRARLVVHPGNRNLEAAAVASVQPSVDGQFSVRLPPGEYCLVEADRHGPLPPELLPPATVSASCWKQRWERCLASFRVEDAPVALGYLLIVHHCPFDEPCIEGAPQPLAPADLEQKLHPKPLPSPLPPPRRQ